VPILFVHSALGPELSAFEAARRGPHRGLLDRPEVESVVMPVGGGRLLERLDRQDQVRILVVDWITRRVEDRR